MAGQIRSAGFPIHLPCAFPVVEHLGVGRLGVRQTATFIREIRRLAELGFITLEVDPESGRELVGIDFNAIEIDFGELAPY